MKVLSRFAPVLVLVIAALFLVSGLFFHASRIVTFDGHIHISTIAQFTQALKDGEFPVSWSDGFGSYGLPLPFIAHQTTSYLGAFLTLLTNNVVFSYTLLFALSAVSSILLFYTLMRRHFSQPIAVIAALLFNFAPYRIINIYVRGALPEFFASTIILLVLLGIAWYFKDRKRYGLAAILGGTALLALTHPMMVVIGMFVIVPYFLFTIWPIPSLKTLIREVVTLGLATALGLGIAAYYVVPLLLEMKYLYEGLYPQAFLPDKFLGWQNFWDPRWYYYYTSPGPRGHFIKTGLLETIVSLSALAVILTNWRSFLKQKSLGIFAVIAIVPLLFFLLWPSLWFYKHVFFLRALQFPWRMLSSLIFLPPIFLAVLLTKYKNQAVLVGFAAVLILVRFPQLYGKNFISYAQDHYYFNIMNLHGQNMTPIWAGNAQEYEPKPQQADIIGGTGEITDRQLKNASRVYQLTAETPLRLVDYTFYFPGWKVRVDGQEVPIEFQDINYRGVITYQVPAGEHRVTVTYEATKVRWLGRLISLASLISAVGVYLILQLALVQRYLPTTHKPGNRHHN